MRISLLGLPEDVAREPAKKVSSVNAKVSPQRKGESEEGVKILWC